MTWILSPLAAIGAAVLGALAFIGRIAILPGKR